jgi:hypothetical protein
MARLILTSLVLALSVLPLHAQSTLLHTDRSGYTTGTWKTHRWVRFFHAAITSAAMASTPKPVMVLASSSLAARSTAISVRRA